MTSLPSPTPINLEGSLALQKRLPGEPKACWKNSICALYAVDWLSLALYVEGWTITQEGLVIDHGWLELDGRVIEATVEVPFRAYFAGVRYTRAEVKWFMGRRSRYTPFVGYGPERAGRWRNGREWNIPAYVRSYVAAEQWFYREVVGLESIPEWISERWEKALASLG
jgi:hypothetical protein